MSMHFFFHSRENNIQFFQQTAPWSSIHKEKEKKSLLSNIWSITMCTVIQQIHIFISKYTGLDVMQQQQVPLQKK